MDFLIIIGVVIFGVVLFNNKLETWWSYLFRIFFKNIAETSEGAESIYNKIIEKVQKENDIAENTYNEIYGKLESEVKIKNSLIEEIKEIESKCLNLIKAEDMDQIDQLSYRRVELIEQLEISLNWIEKLSEAEKNSKEIAQIFSNKLTKLKREKLLILQELEVNEQLDRVYSSLDKLKENVFVDKQLKIFEEEVKIRSAKATGAREINTLKSPLILGDEDIDYKKIQSENYINKLIEKNRLAIEGTPKSTNGSQTNNKKNKNNI